MSNFNKHLFNHKGWLTILNEYGNIVNFEGIILAGWQRQDHFSALTELFPVAIPSLAMSLRLLSGKNYYLYFRSFILKLKYDIYSNTLDGVLL